MRSLEIVQPCDFTLRDGIETGVRGVLRCRGCGDYVTDLGALTEAEGLAFLERRPPRACVRMRVTADGRVVFADGIGSLFGKIADGARPMLSVAALALASCASGPPVSPPDDPSVWEGLPLTTPAPAAPAPAALAPPSVSAPNPPPASAAISLPPPRLPLNSAHDDGELTGFVFNDEPIVPPPSITRPRAR